MTVSQLRVYRPLTGFLLMEIAIHYLKSPCYGKTEDTLLQAANPYNELVEVRYDDRHCEKIRHSL